MVPLPDLVWIVSYPTTCLILQDNVVLSYPGSKEDFRLQIPKFEVKSGEVVAVVGRVGSGEQRVGCRWPVVPGGEATALMGAMGLLCICDEVALVNMRPAWKASRGTF